MNFASPEPPKFVYGKGICLFRESFFGFFQSGKKWIVLNRLLPFFCSHFTLGGLCCRTPELILILAGRFCIFPRGKFL